MIQKQRRHRKRGQHSLYSAPENCRYTVTAVPCQSEQSWFYRDCSSQRKDLEWAVCTDPPRHPKCLGKDIASAILVEEDNTL